MALFGAVLDKITGKHIEKLHRRISRTNDEIKDANGVSDRLVELSTKHHPFPPIIGVKDDGVVQIHEMTCGTSMSWGLLQQKEISVSKWFHAAGTEFPEHSHTQKEWVIVFSGTLIVHTEEGSKELKAGDFVFIEPEVMHSASAPEDVWYLAVAIPKIAGWTSATDRESPCQTTMTD